MLRGEVTQNGGLVITKINRVLRGLGFESAEPPGMGRGELKIELNLVANDQVNHTYGINPNKNSGHRSSEELPGW